MKDEILKLAREIVSVYQDDPVKDGFLSLAYEQVKERYQMVAHRSMTSRYKATFARLIAIYAILTSRGVDAFRQQKKDPDDEDQGFSGAISSISMGDTSVSFASSAGHNLGEGGSDGAIDQTNELFRSFERVWKELIVNTRRLL